MPQRPVAAHQEEEARNREQCPEEHERPVQPRPAGIKASIPGSGPGREDLRRLRDRHLPAFRRRGGGVHRPALLQPGPARRNREGPQLRGLAPSERSRAVRQPTPSGVGGDQAGSLSQGRERRAPGATTTRGSRASRRRSWLILRKLVPEHFFEPSDLGRRELPLGQLVG